VISDNVNGSYILHSPTDPYSLLRSPEESVRNLIVFLIKLIRVHQDSSGLLTDSSGLLRIPEDSLQTPKESLQTPEDSLQAPEDSL
jgi:hypothetical protein